jgi:hypothetical protein
VPLPPGGIDPEEDRQHGERHRELVGNELRRGADAAEEGILRVRGPAGEDERVNTERGHREHREDADIEVGQHERHQLAGLVEVGAERHHGHGRERGDHRDDWREIEVELVHVTRHRILLEEHLAAVGHEVEHTEPLQKANARHPRDPRHDGAIRAGTALHPGGDLALGQRAGAAEGEHDADHREALDDGLQERVESGPEFDHGGHAMAAAGAGLKWSVSRSQKGSAAHGVASSSRPVAGRVA